MSYRVCYLFFIVLLGVAHHAIADSWLRGSPRIIDGHTLSMEGQTVLLAGIRPAGSRQLCQKGARRFPCSMLATSELGRLVNNRTVLCEVLTRDELGRILGRCFVNELDIAEELVRRGLAEEDPSFAHIAKPSGLGPVDDGKASGGPRENLPEKLPAVSDGPQPPAAGGIAERSLTPRSTLPAAQAPSSTPSIEERRAPAAPKVTFPRSPTM
jgi:hypothetical protein